MILELQRQQSVIQQQKDNHNTKNSINLFHSEREVSRLSPQLLRSRVRTNKNENIELSFHTFLRIYFIKLQIKLT